MNGHSYDRYKVEPPGLIKLEKEIEQEEKIPEPPLSPVPPASDFQSPSVSPSISPSISSFSKTNSSRKSTGKILDDAVSNIFLSQISLTVTLTLTKVYFPQE